MYIYMYIHVCIYMHACMHDALYAQSGARTAKEMADAECNLGAAGPKNASSSSPKILLKMKQRATPQD